MIPLTFSSKNFLYTLDISVQTVFTVPFLLHEAHLVKSDNFVPFPLFKGLLNGHLGSPQSKFQISNYHLPYRKLGFFSICALNQDAHTSFSKIIFWKQMKMSLVLEYN
jgi:hypothetical protein